MLGRLRVRNGDQWMPVAAAQQRVVLGVLLVEAGRTVSTQRLIDAVWPQSPPRTAANTIAAYVLRLRRLVGSKTLATRDGGYELVVEENAIDAVVFERQLALGRSELDAGRLQAGVAELAQALALWPETEPALADVPPSPWLEPRVTYLGQLRLSAAEDRAAALLELGRHAEIVDELEQLAREQPLRERRWALLLTALDRCGRRGEALQVYQHARQALAAELGLEPSHTLRELHQAILDADSRVIAPQVLTATVADSREEGPASLPGPMSGGVRLGGTALVNRRPEMAMLRSAIDAASRGRGGSVFLIGEAGIGKSRLAVEAARYAEASGLQVLRGRASGPAMQFRPLSGALLSLLRWSGSQDDPDVAPYLPILSMLVPGPGPKRPAALDYSPAILAEGVLRLAVSAGRRVNGSVLVLEDLHDADPATLAVIDYLIDNVGREPLLVVGTARAEAGAALDLMRAAHRRRVAELMELGRLDERDVRLIAAGCLGVPAAQVPAAVLARLARAADGIPLHVEELVATMVGDGLLVHSGGQWTVAGSIVSGVPAPLIGILTRRVDQLDDQTRALLVAASLAGREFSAEVAGAAAGIDGDALSACMRGALDAGLVVTTGNAYAFRHALMAEALHDRLPPGERVMLCRRLALAVAQAAIEGWQERAAELWSQAGEPLRAASMFADAGRRAAAEGAVTAASLLERGLSLVAESPDSAGLMAELSEALIDVYADAGRLAEAYVLADRLDALLPASSCADVHLRLARAAAVVGHWADGLRELTTTRQMIGRRPEPATAARIDAVAARLTFGNPAPDRLRSARALARRALEAAEATGQPEVACDAIDTLGRCLRLNDMDRADALYRRGLAIAGEHHLVKWQIRFGYQLGAHEGIRTASPARLYEVHSLAQRAGAVVSALTIELDLVFVLLCRADYDSAEQMIRHCGETAERLGLRHLHLIAIGLHVCVAAHHGRVAEVEALLARYHEKGGEENDFASVVRGFGLGVGLMLQDDAKGAAAELRWAATAESARPVPFLSYVPGPHLLLEVLRGQAGTSECRDFARSAQAQAGWNRLFLMLARAVLHGRAGRPAAAQRTFDEFAILAQRYPLAHHLGLRLVAPCAMEDGWGDPVPWLRAAAAYFRQDAPAVASASRRLLRAAGAAVPQHRHGSEDVPLALRERGITVREYEVLGLVSQRLTNQEIGQRLFVSPRTVEKHVARLLLKIGVTDRGALAKMGSAGEKIGAAARADGAATLES
jgi:DNA-binding SARP family transcriptional activator/DNA-binding CsgD family transcriptional regulator